MSKITANKNQLISLKLGVVIEPINRKNWLTVGGDAVRGSDSRSLFHFPHHCGILDFRRFISITETSYFCALQILSFNEFITG